MKIQDFLYCDSTWQDKYQNDSSHRYNTFKIAMNLLMQIPSDLHILETGCQRGKDDWGAGCSSKLFMDFLRQHWYIYESLHHELVSIDTSLPNLKLALSEVEKYIEKPFVNYQPVLSDSLEALRRLQLGQTKNLQVHELGAHTLGDKVSSTKYDLIYLDSYDADITVESENLKAQEHQLKEAELAIPLFKDNTEKFGVPKILLLDDNRLPFGGKTRLTKEYLLDHHWLNLFDWQQSLWVKF